MTKTAAQRQKDYRDKKRNAQGVTASLDHYHRNASFYIPRREPDKLNWGAWLNMAQLEQAGLKANRVPIPGDWDYVGVAA